MKLLLERTTLTTDSKDNKGRTPLSWAVRFRHDRIVELLLKWDDVDADSNDYYVGERIDG